MIPTESSEMPVSEIDVIAASSENNVQIEIEENQKRVKKNTTMEVAFNKVNYHFLKWFWYSLASFVNFLLQQFFPEK